MYQIGETVRIAKNIPGDKSTWFRIGDLVRVTRVIPGGYQVEDGERHTCIVAGHELQEDHSLPLFDEYRRETTGCLF